MKQNSTSPFIRAIEQNGPMVMGILNVNPDSFYDGGKYQGCNEAIAHAKQMAQDGAQIIDVGGESTRPGAQAIKLKAEWQRIGAVLKQLRAWLCEENVARAEQNQPQIWLSVDTYKAEIARRSLDFKVDIINDVSGGYSEPEILNVVASANANYILMHNPFVLPQYLTAQGLLPHAKRGSQLCNRSISQIAAELRNLYERARNAGCKNIVIDPGLGFGKSYNCNWQILARLKEFIQAFCCPIYQPQYTLCPPLLIGASNKRFVRHDSEQLEQPKYQDTNKDYKEIPKNFLGENLAICSAAILGGAKIIRSHEVREHYRCLRSLKQILKHQENRGDIL